jgi:group I intron endonuclease
MEIYGYIYLIENSINGKRYVGQTEKTISQRWNSHKRSRSSQYPIHLALKKYGVQNFTISQIDCCISEEELNRQEKYWIARLNTIVPNGYNLSSGGDHYKMHENTKRKISNSHLGIGVSREARAKISRANTGRVNGPQTKEFIERRAQKLRGKSPSPETRKKLSDAVKKRWDEGVYELRGKGK